MISLISSGRVPDSTQRVSEKNDPCLKRGFSAVARLTHYKTKT
jgi:hypothetical protein